MMKINKKAANLICPYDRDICTGFDSLDCSAECSKCIKYNNGVCKTGSMRTLEIVYNYLKNKWKKLLQQKQNQ